MTRCKEFYEKLEKDGNFCGMSRRSFEDAVKYWDGYRKEAEESGDKSPKSEKQWIIDNRKEVAAHKYVEPEKPKPSQMKQYDFAKEVNNTIIFWLTLRDEETIREVVEKALVNNREG